jgi:hypothetical protein
MVQRHENIYKFNILRHVWYWGVIKTAQIKLEITTAFSWGVVINK